MSNNKHTFTVGQIIYHGWRYWKSEDLEAGEVLGWNTRYIAYKIDKITAKRIAIYPPDIDDISQTVYLNRETMERDGKQYHSRFHEYFYAEKPRPESKDWNWAGNKPGFVIPNFTGDCLTTLGLTVPYTSADVRRAYKRLAKTAHPDLGGSHQAFIKLRQAHDSALRFATS
jgi:hypothetical protein